MLVEAMGRPTNKRKAKCPDCKKVLLPGEGIRHSYPMFHGNGEFYYVCPPCEEIREKEKAEIVKVMNANN